MIRQVIVTPEADRDLDRQFDYLARDSLETAVRFLRAAHATFAELLDTPGIGIRKRLRNRRLAHVRQWRVHGFERYLIYYRETWKGSKFCAWSMARAISPGFSRKGESETAGGAARRVAATG